MRPAPFDTADSQRFPLSNAASVEIDGDVAFGTLRAVTEDRLELEADLLAEVGDAVLVRLSLVPAPGTALVHATVTRRLLVAPGESPRFVARVTDVAEADRERCTAWLDAVRLGGGTLSTFSGVSDVSGRRSGAKDALRLGMRRGITVLE